MHTNYPKKNRQSGLILVTVLIMLVLLTLLGLSTMTTSTLEERMAANVQETNRAFQAAESGIMYVYDDHNAFSLDSSHNYKKTRDIKKNATESTDYGGKSTHSAKFKQVGVPYRGSGWDSNYRFYYFDLSSEGRTSSGAVSVLNAGIYQVGPAGTSQ